jgi:subtilase family serine protease
VTGPAPSADLVVSAIRVPGGANDCDPGKNDVTVVVTNAGGAAATGFAVRVFVDDKDDEAKEKAGLALDASKELTVRVDDLRIPKGQHTLTATADSQNAVAEANDANNELKTTVRCRDD